MPSELAHLASGGVELTRGVREYLDGDPIRSVHWPATARTGAVMVREYEGPRRPARDPRRRPPLRRPRARRRRAPRAWPTTRSGPAHASSSRPPRSTARALGVVPTPLHVGRRLARAGRRTAGAGPLPRRRDRAPARRAVVSRAQDVVALRVFVCIAVMAAAIAALGEGAGGGVLWVAVLRRSPRGLRDRLRDPPDPAAVAAHRAVGARRGDHAGVPLGDPPAVGSRGAAGAAGPGVPVAAAPPRARHPEPARSAGAARRQPGAGLARRRAVDLHGDRAVAVDLGLRRARRARPRLPRRAGGAARARHGPARRGSVAPRSRSPPRSSRACCWSASACSCWSPSPAPTGRSRSRRSCPTAPRCAPAASSPTRRSAPGTRPRAGTLRRVVAPGVVRVLRVLQAARHLTARSTRRHARDARPRVLARLLARPDLRPLERSGLDGVRRQAPPHPRRSADRHPARAGRRPGGGRRSTSTSWSRPTTWSRPGPNAIFAASQATKVYFPDRSLFQNQDGTLRAGVRLDPGAVYTVVSQRALVTPEALRRPPVEPVPEDIALAVRGVAGRDRPRPCAGPHDHRGRADDLRQGARDRAVARHPHAVLARHPPPAEGRRRGGPVPVRGPQGLLRADRHRARGDAARARHPRAPRRRVHARRAQPVHRAVRGQGERRARLGRGVLPGHRLAGLRSRPPPFRSRATRRSTPPATAP